MTHVAARTRALRAAALCSAAGLALSLSACDSSIAGEAGETYTIRLADYMPPTHFLATDLIVPWQEEVTERTGGRVTFDYYPGGQLVETSELYAALQGGVVDAAIFPPTVAAPVDLPLSGVVALPGIQAPSGLPEASAAYTGLLLGSLAGLEWEPKGVTPMLGLIVGQNQLVNRGAPVRGIDDWRGLTVRGSGGMLDIVIVEAGGAAATLATTEIYEALQRRTIDTSITSGETAAQYKLEEVAESISVNSQLGLAAVTLAMSTATWDGFPPDIQHAIREASAAALERFGQATAGLFDSIREQLGDQVDFYTLTAEEVESLHPAVTAAQAAWISEHEAQGLPAQEVFDEWVRAARAAAGE